MLEHQRREREIRERERGELSCGGGGVFFVPAERKLLQLKIVETARTDGRTDERGRGQEERQSSADRTDRLSGRASPD